MLSQEQVKEYYRTADLVLPDDAKHRQFKVQLFSGRWITSRRTINSVDKLRKFLVKTAPKNAYMSNTRFLFPTIHEKKSDKSNKYIINSDVWIETDSKDVNLAKEEILKAYELIREEFSFLKFKTCKFSGRKGYYLFYEAPEEEILNPDELIAYHYALKGLICDHLINNGLKTIDARYNEKGKLTGTMWDIDRVSRLTNSIRATGEVCIEFKNIEELKNHTPQRTENPMTGTEPEEKPVPLHLNKREECRGGVRHPHFSYLSKNGNNTILHARVKNLDRLDSACRIYNLSDLIVFKREKGYAIISPRLYNPRRAYKIMKYLKSENNREMSLNGYSRIPFYEDVQMIRLNHPKGVLSTGHLNMLYSTNKINFKGTEGGYASPKIYEKDETECPSCGSEKITHIPSSTLPILNNTYLDGSPVGEETLRIHKSIRWICNDCVMEW